MTDRRLVTARGTSSPTPIGPFVQVPHRTLSVGSTSTRGSRRQRLEAEWFGIGAELGESPVWLERRGEMASVDVTGQRLHLLRPDSGMDEVIELPVRVNAAMPGSASTIVLAADRSLHAWLIDDRVLRPMAHLPGHPPVGTRFNDGKVDRAGRVWIGARRPDGAAGSGVLLSWETGRSPVIRVRGLTGPNGLTWSVAGDRLYLADSRERQIHRYRFDETGGSVSDGQVFASWSDREGRPDGLTVDVDDHLWCAAWDAGCIRRYDPLGRLVQTIVLPAIRPTSCAFGGSAIGSVVGDLGPRAAPRSG